MHRAEQVRAELRELLVHSLDARRVEVVLGAEVVMHHRQADVGALRDVSHRRAVASLAEEQRRALQDAHPGRVRIGIDGSRHAH